MQQTSEASTFELSSPKAGQVDIRAFVVHIEKGVSSTAWGLSKFKFPYQSSILHPLFRFLWALLLWTKDDSFQKCYTIASTLSD